MYIRGKGKEFKTALLSGEGVAVDTDALGHLYRGLGPAQITVWAEMDGDGGGDTSLVIEGYSIQEVIRHFLVSFTLKGCGTFP